MRPQVRYLVRKRYLVRIITKIQNLVRVQVRYLVKI